MTQLLPCLSLMLLLFHLCRIDSMEDSYRVEWTDLDVTGLKGNSKNWENITQWLGRELCKDSVRTPANPFTCEDFKNFIMPLGVGVTAMRVSCEGDKALNGTTVCWLREKSYNSDTASKRTVFEVQFWTENPKLSHCRYANPSVYTKNNPGK
uniref:Uncharacterized protein n=1 Tax=Cacopsylla melanoneura TaxID=428564 RepID=A0A8D8SRP1_9HEMI